MRSAFTAASVALVSLTSLASAALTACEHASPEAVPVASRSSSPVASSAPVSAPALACPPAKPSVDPCAAVQTAVKNPATGACCVYGSPCEVPLDGPQFSDDKCTRSAGFGAR